MQLLPLPTTPVQITLPRYQKMPVSAAWGGGEGSRQRFKHRIECSYPTHSWWQFSPALRLITSSLSLTFLLRVMHFYLVFGNRRRMLLPEGRSRFACASHSWTYRIPAANVLATLMLLSWANGLYDNFPVRRTRRLYLCNIERAVSSTALADAEDNASTEWGMESTILSTWFSLRQGRTCLCGSCLI